MTTFESLSKRHICTIRTNKMKTLGTALRKSLTITFAIIGISASAQTIDVGPPDTSVCDGQAIDLMAVTNGTGGTAGLVTTVSLSDDQHSGVIDITFPFEYYGIPYTQLLISSNSYVTFDLGGAGGYSPWGINNAIPNAAMPTNAIMFPYQDTNPNSGGVISYVVCGEAPNRVFIVDFFEVAMFSCTNLQFTNQVKLFETSNRIETHIANKPLCAAWNGGVAIHGLHNATGTAADVVPGRNYPTQWTATNDGYEFLPNGGGYTINPIPYDAAPLSGSSLIWSDNMGNANLGTNPTLTVSPAVATMYYCTVQLPCGVGVAVQDSILVTIGNANLTAVPANPSCVGFADGSVTVDPTGSVYPVTVDILAGPAPGGALVQSQANVTGVVTMGGLPAGAYTAQVTDAGGCGTVLDFLITDPPALTITTETLDASCFGYNDGYVIVQHDGQAVEPITIGVEDNGALVSQMGGVALFDTLMGLYAGSYDVIMIDANGCPAIPNGIVIDEPTDLVPNAGNTNILCYGEENGRAWSAPSGSVPPYEYSWNDQFGQSTDTIEYLAAGAYTVTITDDHNCFTDTTVIINQPDQLELVITTGEDTCLQSNAFIRADMDGGITPYTYIWSEIKDSAHFYTDSFNFFNIVTGLSGGDYSLLVVDSNECEIEGETTVATIPPPHSEFLTRSKPEEIIDPMVLFDNNSTSALTYEWWFGDGDISYDENPEHEYVDTSGTFLVMLVARNEPEYGCADTSWQYVDVVPYFTVYLPNAFTPDGDGLNDEFGMQANHFDYESFRMTIYDRWGNIMFITDNPTKWWDGKSPGGKAVKEGIFVYLVELKKFNIFEPKVITGTVYVHRQHVQLD